MERGEEAFGWKGRDLKVERCGRCPKIVALQFLEGFNDKPESRQGWSRVEGKEDISWGKVERHEPRFIVRRMEAAG